MKMKMNKMTQIKIRTKIGKKVVAKALTATLMKSRTVTRKAQAAEKRREA